MNERIQKRAEEFLQRSKEQNNVNVLVVCVVGGVQDGKSGFVAQ